MPVTVRVVLGVIAAALVAVSAAGAAVSGTANHRLATRCLRTILAERRTPARASPGSADPQVAAELALFRAPRTAADALPSASSVAHALGGVGATSYDPSLATRVDLPARSQGTVYAVPAALAIESVPARCAHVRALAGVRSAIALRNEETGSGAGVCLVTTQVVMTGRLPPVLPGKPRPPGGEQTLANAGCESLAVMASYLGTSGGGLSAGGPPVALVPDGVSSVTYARADGRRYTAQVTGNLLTVPTALRRSVNARHASRAQLRRLAAAQLPVSVIETGANGAVVARFARPPGLVDQLVRLIEQLKSALHGVRTSVGGGSRQTTASCSARTHRCVTVVVSTYCIGGHHRCVTRRSVQRYRYVGSRPPRGTTGHVLVPTAPIRARLNRYLVHPHKLSLVLSGTPQRHVDVIVTVGCFAGHPPSPTSTGELGAPRAVAVPSRVPLVLPRRHQACDIDVLAMSPSRAPVHLRLVAG